MFGEESTSPLAYGDRVALQVRKETLVLLEEEVLLASQDLLDKLGPREPLVPQVQREPLEPLVLPDLLKNLLHLSMEQQVRLRV